MNYITLTQVRQQLKLMNNITTDTDLFNNWIQWSCGLIDWWKGRRFDIFQKTYLLDVPGYESNSNQFGSFQSAENMYAPNEIYLNTAMFDLLEVIELLNGDAVEIENTQYYIEPIYLPGKNRITLKRGYSWKLNSDGEYKQVISLTGFFGYNLDYPNCFVDTGEATVDAPMTTSQTEIVVNNILLPAKDFIAPKIQAGQMLRLKSTAGTEFLLVEAVTSGDYDDYSITVRRAFNGTTAYAHAAGTKIEVYRPDADIVQMALRLVQWRYRQKDQDNFDKTFNLATQVSSTPTAFPADVRAILGRRRPVL